MNRDGYGRKEKDNGKGTGQRAYSRLPVGFTLECKNRADGGKDGACISGAFTALYVKTPEEDRMDEADKKRLLENRKAGRTVWS